MQPGQYGVFTQVLQAFGAGRGEPGECLQQGIDGRHALTFDRLGTAVGQLALIALAAAGADRQYRAGDAA